MSDIKDWAVSAGGNTSTSPDGFPEGMPPSGVNDAAREVMAAVARNHRDQNPYYTATGAANNYVLDKYERSVGAYTQGLMAGFIANHSNTGSATLAIQGLAAKTLYDSTGRHLESSAISTHQPVIAAYSAKFDAFFGLSLGRAGGLVPIRRVPISGSPGTVDFVHGTSGVVFNDTYELYAFVLTFVRPATDGVNLRMRVGTGAGPTYQTTSYHFCGRTQGPGAGDDFGSTLDSVTDSMLITNPAVGISNTEGVSGIVFMSNPIQSGELRRAWFDNTYYTDANALSRTVGAGEWDGSTAVTAARFYFSSGNFDNVGSITLCGVRT